MEPVGIRVLDTVDNILAPSIVDILKNIPSAGEYYWSILFVEGILQPNSGWTINKIENVVNNSPLGFRLSWEDLLKFGEKFFQIYDLAILANKESSKLKRYDFIDEEIYINNEIVISLIDSSFWEIITKEKKILENLQRQFKKTKFIYKYPDY